MEELPLLREPEPPRLTPVGLSLRVTTDFDQHRMPWLGAQLSVQVGVADAAFLGIALGAAWQPEHQEVARRVWRLVARAGWQTEVGAGRIFLGAGVGLVSARAKRGIRQGRSTVTRSPVPFSSYSVAWTHP